MSVHTWKWFIQRSSSSIRPSAVYLPFIVPLLGVLPLNEYSLSHSSFLVTQCPPTITSFSSPCFSHLSPSILLWPFHLSPRTHLHFRGDSWAHCNPNRCPTCCFNSNQLLFLSGGGSQNPRTAHVPVFELDSVRVCVCVSRMDVVVAPWASSEAKAGWVWTTEQQSAVVAGRSLQSEPPPCRPRLSPVPSSTPTASV